MSSTIKGRRPSDRPDQHASTAELLAVVAGPDREAAWAALELLDRLDEAREETTQEAYDRAEMRWVHYALRHRIEPWNPPAPMVAAWFEQARHKLGWPTIQRRATALRDGFLRRGLPDPTRDPLVVRTLASLKAGVRQRTWDHRPLLVEDYLRLRRSLASGSLRDLRDRLAFGLGFLGQLSIAQVARLSVEAVAFDPRGLLVHVRSRGGVRRVEIARTGTDDLVADAREWLERAGLTNGPLLREVRHGRLVGTRPISCQNWAIILKHRLREAGLDEEHHAWGSFKQGFLASSKLRGVDDLELAQRAGYSGLASLRTALREIDARGTPLLAAPRLTP